MRDPHTCQAGNEEHASDQEGKHSGGRATAEDMAQDVFVKTFRSRIRAQGQPLLSLDPNRVLGPAPVPALEERQRAEAVCRAVVAAEVMAAVAATPSRPRGPFRGFVSRPTWLHR